MINLTFAQLCAEFVDATDKIARLSGIMPSYRSDEHPYELEVQKTRRDALKAELKRRLDESPR